MPPRSSTTEPWRRRGGRRGGALAASSRHRQASVKSFFAKAASPKPHPPSPPALRPPSSQSIPCETPSAPDSPSIPDEAPEVRCLDHGQLQPADKPNAKNEPPSQDIPEEAAEVKQLDEPAAVELATAEVVDVDACEDEPAAAELAASGADAQYAVPSHWHVMSLSSCIDVAPSSDLQIVSPFLPVSIPPKGKASMASPVTPGNPRSGAKGKPPRVPCAGLSEDEPEAPSRLSRRRNLVRRAAVRAVQKATGIVQMDDDPIAVDDGEEEEPAIRRARKRSCPKSSPEKEKKVLHPFFAATAVSVKEPRDRPKRPRIVRPPSDAWAYTGSTVHVNYGNPLLPWTTLPGLRVFADKPDLEVKPTGLVAPTFDYYPSASPRMRSTAAPREDERPVRRKFIEVQNANSEMWAEKYKEDRQVDVISAAPTKDLVDWLTPWYVDKSGRVANDNDSSDDESMCSSICEPDPCEKERIVIISGPVGCGKSTIVAKAARQLGLTILEINASTCRTGKRVRDIIGEALRTHRVASNKFRKPATNGLKGKSTGIHADDDTCGFDSSSAKTLILFEEVDELQEDEKGFWPSLQELVASDDCRRPIICTANSFSSHMKQIFAVPKEPVDADFDRLLINTKEDHILNPMAYKHISFPERSERQTTAVLKRVLTSEKVKLPPDAVDFLALTHRTDTRRAVNLLHFLGLRGLHSLTGSKDLPDSGIIERLVTESDWSEATEFGVNALMIGGDVIQASFHVGSEGYGRKCFHTEDFSPAHTEEQKQNTNALDAWCTSLDTMSYADTILNSAESETRKRCGESFSDELCLDVDLQTSTGIMEELDSQALRHSRDYLCLDEKTCSLALLATDMQATTLAPDVLVLHDCPNPRRPILSDYIPTLRTMACEERSGFSKGKGNNGKVQERVLRRTRASMKKGGFCALDLNISTVSELKRSALRSQL